MENLKELQNILINEINETYGKCSKYGLRLKIGIQHIIFH